MISPSSSFQWGKNFSHWGLHHGCKSGTLDESKRGIDGSWRLQERRGGVTDNMSIIYIIIIVITIIIMIYIYIHNYTYWFMYIYIYYTGNMWVIYIYIWISGVLTINKCEFEGVHVNPFGWVIKCHHKSCELGYVLWGSIFKMASPGIILNWISLLEKHN
jgi:hypothetical protein